jgi:hypothetical protein
MAKELKLRRGNAVEHSLFVGAEGEITYNTDRKTSHVHDGLTSGGFELARTDLSNITNTDFAAKAAAAGVQGGEGGGTVVGAAANASYLIIGTDVWGLENERRIQAGNGIEMADGGAGGAFVVSARLANSGSPSNLGAATIGGSNFIARADHVHAMPTAVDVQAIPNNRVIQPGSGIAVSGSGLLTANTTVSLNAVLNDLTNVAITNPANNDLLIFEGASSTWRNFSGNALGRMTVRQSGTVIGTANSVTTLNFTGNAVATAVDGTDPNRINLTFNHLGQNQIENIVGAMVSGNTETGINVTYTGGKLNFQTNNFSISLAGDVQGTATVNDLGNVTINTVVTPNAIALGTDTTGNYVASVLPSSNHNGIVVTGAVGEGTLVEIGLDVNELNFVEAVQDIIGSMVSNNIENGINVSYNDVGTGALGTGKLNFQTNNFSVTLQGAVEGSGTVTNLSNMTMTTSIASDAIALGTHTTGNYVRSISSGSAGVSVTGSGGESADVSISLDLSSGPLANNIQEVVGEMVSGNTESGLSVTFNPSTRKLNFDVDDPTITLTGAITGGGTLTNLSNLSISTSHANNSVSLGVHTSGNYAAGVAQAATSNGITVVGGTGVGVTPTVGLNLADANFVEGVQDIVGTMVTGNIENGIAVIYDDPSGKLDFQVNPFSITLSGAVTGTGTVTNLSNVNLNTSLTTEAITLGTHTTGNYLASLAPTATSNGITVSGSGVPTAAALVGLNLTDVNFVEGVQDIIGTMVSGNIENGIAVTYDDAGLGTGKLNFQTNNFNISLTGAVTGTGTVTNLGNVSFATTIGVNAVALGSQTTGNYLAALAPAATSNGITVSGSGSPTAEALVGLNMADTNFVENIQDIIGTMVSGNIENGINVTYDDAGLATGKLNFQTNNFSISLTGPVTGTGTVTNLGNVSFATTISSNAVALGSQTTGNYVATVAPTATSNGITVVGSGSPTAAIQVGFNLNDANFVEGVQDIIGTMVSGNIENGIAVTYDDPNGKLDFQVNPFTISLTGPISGTGTVTNLSNVNLTTTVGANAITLGSHTTGNYVQSVAVASPGNGISITGAAGQGSTIQVGINLSDANFVEGVQDIIGTMVSANVETGINVTYDDPNGKLDFQVNPFTITLTGVVTGSTTITNLASSNLLTSIGDDSIILGQHTVGNYISTIVTTGTSNGITITGSGTETAAAVIGLNMADSNFIENIQDIIGGMVTSNVENGINVTYNDAGLATGKLDFQVNPFTISLTGATTGSATVTNLGNVAITTTQGTGSVTLGTHTTGNYIATVAAGATPNGILVTNGSTVGGAAQISFDLNNADFREAVEDYVATMYTGVTHSAITSTYNDAAGKITLAVQNGVVDAATLGSYAAVAFPRKAEAAQITQQWSFNSDIVLNKAGGNLISFDQTMALARSGVGNAVEIDASRNVRVSTGTLSVGNNLVIHEGNIATNAIAREAVEDYVATLFSSGTHGNLNFVYNDAAGSMNVSVNSVNLNADTLDNFDSTAFTRKAENASVTGTWSFVSPGRTATAHFSTNNGAGAALSLYPDLTAGSYNGLVQAGDAAVIATSPLVLANNTAGTTGLRLTSAGVQVAGTFTHSGSNILSEATGMQRAGTHGGSGSYNPDTLTTTGVSSGDVAIAGGSLAGWQVLSAFRPANTNYGMQIAVSDTESNRSKIRSKINGNWGTWADIWTTNNDGAGSGLDADLLDGLNSTQFVRNDASSTLSAGNKISFTVQSGKLVDTATDNGAPLEIVQPSTTAGDAFITFHNTSRYSTHFGLDSATSDIFVGGWSMGTAKNRIFHARNIHRVAQPLRSHFNMTGGGSMSYDGSNVRWTQRFIIISSGRGTHFSAGGYFDITCPTAGTITGVGGSANKTATASGIPLTTWEALYYILPIGGSSESLAANFRVVNYTSELEIPEHWVLVALHNADQSSVKFTACPFLLASGENYTAGVTTTMGMNVVPDANNTRNMGTASLRYNTIFATTFNGTATAAQYADVAERYSADAIYEPGTVVVFGGDAEITISSEMADRRAAGVISTDPAFMMNSGAGSNETHPYVALVGRVPCRVTGTIRKGDMLTTSDMPGHATSTDDPKLGSIIGKALEDFNGESGVIEIAVQRM